MEAATLSGNFHSSAVVNYLLSQGQSPEVVSQ